MLKLINAHDTIKNNSEKIIDNWLNSNSLSKVLKKIKLDMDRYKTDVANKVMEYFLNIIINKEKVGDCPAMRKLVETFLDSGLSVEDVFLNCTVFKNNIIETLYDNDIQKEDIQHIATILDTNLHRILGIYTEQKINKQKRYAFHSQLIEEHVALSATDTEGKIIYVTDAFCKLSGYSEEELIGKTHSIIKHPDMPHDFFKSMWAKIKKNHTWKGKVKNKKKDGGEFIAKTEIIPYFNDKGNVIEYVSIRHDITDKELSNIDPLTNVYNRRYYKSNINIILKKHSELSFMILDIDHFKKINDRFGHSFGDLVLKEFAKILAKKIKNKDLCVRWGGEEFIILLPDTKLEKATDIAQRIRKSVEKTVITDESSENNVNISCSIGVTQRDDDETHTATFKRADENLYTAKKSGRNMVIAK